MDERTRISVSKTIGKEERRTETESGKENGEFQGVQTDSW
jgi:hypothetical protein